RDRFYDHLADCVNDGLVFTTCPTGSLQELIEAAIDIDNRRITRAWEQGKKLVDDGILTKFRPSTVATPFTAPTRDPNAMDIDATTTTRSPDAFHCFMIGRCYGCGSKEHCKADGHHEQDICRHCGLNGHVEAVCRRKFLGLP
ncbi:hypothetical protein F5877DRAFT_29334, partial [Lentinula edodes]